MSKEKEAFEDGVAAVAEAAAAAPTKPATTTGGTQSTTTTMARPAVAHDYSDFDGELEKGDITIPKLNIAQSIGPLSDDFPKGAWVLNRAVQLAAVGEELRFTPLSATKSYVEALEYSSDEFPRVFKTRQAVLDAGLRVEFDGDTGEKPEVNQCLDVVVLIREGKVESPEFALDFEGERFALAQWTIGSWSAYQSAARPLLTARTLYLKTFDQREWVAVTEKKMMKNGNTTMIPKLLGGPNNSDAFKDWARSLVG
jgi:hypothetical protein